WARALAFPAGLRAAGRAVSAAAAVCSEPFVTAPSSPVAGARFAADTAGSSNGGPANSCSRGAGTAALACAALRAGTDFTAAFAGNATSAGEKGSSSRPNRTTTHSSPAAGSRSSTTWPTCPATCPADAVNTTFGRRPVPNTARSDSTSASDNPRAAVRVAAIAHTSVFVDVWLLPAGTDTFRAARPAPTRAYQHSHPPRHREPAPASATTDQPELPAIDPHHLLPHPYR